MRLIDVDNLKPDTKTFTSAYSEELRLFYSQEVIDNAPTVDAEIVRHGKWKNTHVKNVFGAIQFECSACRFKLMISSEHYANRNEYERYCCHCGAKMDLEDNENES